MGKLSSHILLFTSIAIGLLSYSCSNNTHKQNTRSENIIDSLVPHYSHSFRVDYYKGFKVVTVYAGNYRKFSVSYLLQPEGKPVKGFDGAIRINYPVKRLVCISTTHIGALKILGARNLIVAAANKDLIYDSIVRAMIETGGIKDVGKDYQPDYEIIAASKPDLLFTDGENAGTSQIFAKLNSLGVKVVGVRDYFEQEPLARAEWIKFFAAFIGKEKMADSIFKDVKANYLTEIGFVAETGERPTVFCNTPYNGIWYMPCGENYVAKLITDAGGNFLWNTDKPMNGLNLTLNFEEVYRKAADADFWLNAGTLNSLNELGNADFKFKLFKAFKTGKVYNPTNRVSAGGGMDIWETGSYRPDLILNDIALILHSKNTLQANKLYYYKQLK